MKISEATNKLRALGVRTPVEVVGEAVQRLRNGESIYRLHSGVAHLVARATARKIKKLLDEGKLGFLFEVQPELETADTAIGKSQEFRFLFPSAPLPDGTMADATVRELREYCPDVDWNIESLERLGLPLEEALGLLVEHASLQSGKTQWNLSDRRRFLEIHFFVDYWAMHAWKKHSPPHEIIKLAASAMAKGETDNNPFLMQTAENMMSFQIWRGARFLEAFNQAQIANNRSARRLKREYDELVWEIFHKPESEALLQEWRQTAIEVFPELEGQFEEQTDG
ncbi:MAG: hypothetical protein O2913_13265 [Chloroflexi bacterium]|nr:hypothetical protein [Chloroflexota bacterium]